MTRARFRPRAWAFALACLACGAGVALGNWQRSRAEEKQALAVRIAQGEREPTLDLNGPLADAANLVWRRVRLEGEFLADKTVLLGNRSRAGRAGFEVVTPLRLGTSAKHVLVERGWIAASAQHAQVPAVATPAGKVRIEGVVVDHIARVFAPGAPATGPVQFNLEVETFARANALALLPLVVEQRSDSGDGLLREWPRPDTGVERHLMYAWQWYSLGALALVLFIVLSFRRAGADGR